MRRPRLEEAIGLFLEVIIVGPALIGAAVIWFFILYDVAHALDKIVS